MRVPHAANHHRDAELRLGLLSRSNLTLALFPKHSPFPLPQLKNSDKSQGLVLAPRREKETKLRSLGNVALVSHLYSTEGEAQKVVKRKAIDKLSASVYERERITMRMCLLEAMTKMGKSSSRSKRVSLLFLVPSSCMCL